MQPPPACIAVKVHRGALASRLGLLAFTLRLPTHPSTPADVLAVAKADRRWEAMGLRQHLQASAAFENARGAGAKAADAAAAKKAAARRDEGPAVGLQPITNFMQR